MHTHMHTYIHIHIYHCVDICVHMYHRMAQFGFVSMCIYIFHFGLYLCIICTCVSDLLQLQSGQAGMNVCIYINCINLRTFVFVCMVVHVCVCTYVLLALAYAQVVLARILLCRGSKNIELVYAEVPLKRKTKRQCMKFFYEKGERVTAKEKW